MNKAWFPERFSEVEKIKFILKKANPIDTKDLPYLKLFYNASFSDAIYIQLYWEGASMNIVTSTLKSADNSIRIEEGVIADEYVQQTILKVQSLDVKLLDIDYDDREGRDGGLIELAIGRKQNKTTLSWWNAATPAAWESLDVFVEEILSLEKGVDYKNCFVKKMELAIEVDEWLGNKSLLLEYYKTKE